MEGGGGVGRVAAEAGVEGGRKWKGGSGRGGAGGSEGGSGSGRGQGRVEGAEGGALVSGGGRRPVEGCGPGEAGPRHILRPHGTMTLEVSRT